MWSKRIVTAVLIVAPSLPFAQAQSPGTGAGGEGREMDGYQVQQTIELGYRFTDVSGSNQVYNTFIDQQQGPRILDQSLIMRSMTQAGSLFDSLEASSFGWGGDPENVARLRMSKYRWYDFTGLFRRDKNYFDYDLFANPLNPITTPSFPVNSSPHSMFTTRRMYDFGLSILPQSRFTVRLGYSRNRAEGPTLTTIHEGTDALLGQPWNYTSNQYRIGFDLKVLPRTTLNYDQYVTADKNDTSSFLASFAPGLLPGGVPVELGLPWNPASNSPCAVPFTGGAVNPSCNGYFVYTRTQRARSTSPTEQLGISSTYFKRLNIVARGTYSSGTPDSPYSEFFNGLIQRTGERQITISGPASVRRVSANADLGVTVEITRSLHLNEGFRFDNFRIPGQWNSLTASTLGVTPSLLSPLGATTTTASVIFNFLGQKSYQNQFLLEYVPSRHVGGHIGYRFRHRHIFKAEPEVNDPEAPFETLEGDDFDINESTGLAGIWFRPNDAIRMNFDVEFTTADNFLTRVSPRQWQTYKGRINHKVGRWATFGISAEDSESRNGESDTNLRQHLRNAGFVVTLLPSERFNLDLAYNYTDALQNAFICYNGTFVAPGTVVNGCPTFDPTNPGTIANNPNPNSIYSNYANTTHYFHGNVTFSPAKRLHTSLGYGLMKTDGSTTILNPLQPFGPLQFTYHQPTASASYDVVKNFSLNAYWNYDQYNEASFVGPTLPRYFHDNRTTLSAKYSF